MASMQPQAITKVSISALVISLPIIYVSLLRVPPSTLARDSTFWFLMSNSIISIIAANSGVLFFSSASKHDLDYSDVVPGDEQAVAAVHEDYYRDAIFVPLMACAHEPTAPVDMSAVVAEGGEHLPTSGVVSYYKAADAADVKEGRALALIEGEGAPSKPVTDMVDRASALQRCEEEEAPELEPISANKDDATIVKGHQWAISPATGTEVKPEDDDDLRHDQSSVQVMRQEVRPGCSVAEQSKPPPEERQYWQLSDEELNRKVEEFISRFNRDMIEQEAAAV